MTDDTFKIGLVGCGHRGIVGFLDSLKDIGRKENVVALCDSNPARLNFAHEHLQNDECDLYEGYNEFLAHPGLNAVIVATPDYLHRQFVVPACRSGKDVLCEKPLATNLEDCRAMLDAKQNSSLRVAFNLRFNAVSRQVKELIENGVLGRILHVEARDSVGWPHGSDYFRRWHRLQEKSGGLIIHKSTHTFDVINWWLNGRPSKVTASAARRFYNPDHQRSKRCKTCEDAERCRYYVDLTKDVEGQKAGIKDFYKRLYMDGEVYDGYQRDTCVFHAESDIPDTYAVTVSYEDDTLLSYNALFYSAYEERFFALQGTKGRMEVFSKKRQIVLYRDNKAENREVIDVPEEKGGHGGADIHLVRSFFEEVPHGLRATAEDGYWSLAIGVCANESVERGGMPVDVPQIGL